MARWKCFIVLVWLSVFCYDVAYSCSWSNEGCSEDSDCCSNSCHRAHEGTNPRCRHSTLGEKCVFDYHCQDTLTCGPHFNCCSPFWKMCMKQADCCNTEHVCRPVEGFYYKRCLFPTNAATPSLDSRTALCVCTLAVAFHWVKHTIWNDVH